MKYISAALLIIFLISCGTGNKIKEENMDTIYEKWELNILDGKQVSGISPIHITLSKEGKVNGFIGCNQLTGLFTIENENEIRFSQTATTRMMCPEPAMTYESHILEVLNTTDNFTLKDGTLMLNVGRRAPLAAFKKMAENEIIDKYWKLKKLDGQDIQMVANQEKEQYFMLKNDGSLSGFAGCNQFNGQYELKEENRISFNENMAVTMRACPDVELDENAFLSVFNRTDNYTINDDVLSLNIGKRAPLAVFEAIYF